MSKPDTDPDPRFPSWINPDEPLVDWATLEAATRALVATVQPKETTQQ